MKKTIILTTLMTSFLMASTKGVLVLGTAGAVIGNVPGALIGMMIGTNIKEEQIKPKKIIKIKESCDKTKGEFCYIKFDVNDFNRAMSEAKEYIRKTSNHAELKGIKQIKVLKTK
jgi:hypothetical protein